MAVESEGTTIVKPVWEENWVLSEVRYACVETDGGEFRADVEFLDAARLAAAAPALVRALMDLRANGWKFSNSQCWCFPDRGVHSDACLAVRQALIDAGVEL